MQRTARVGFVALVVLAVASVAFSAGEAAKPVTMAPDQIKWVANPTVPGVMTAVTWGDMEKGPHGAFHKFTAGFTAPLHTHSANTRIVVISGTMSMTGEDGKEMKFPADRSAGPFSPTASRRSAPACPRVPAAAAPPRA